MTDPAQLKAVATSLRELRRSSPTTPDTLKDWYAQAHAFADSLSVVAPGVELPHFVWHYLPDADVRIKEPWYRDSQDVALLEIITRLETGQVPPSKETSIPLPVVLIAGAVLAVAGYFLFKWLAPSNSFKPKPLRGSA